MENNNSDVFFDAIPDDLLINHIFVFIPDLTLLLKLTCRRFNKVLAPPSIPLVKIYQWRLRISTLQRDLALLRRNQDFLTYHNDFVWYQFYDGIIRVNYNFEAHKNIDLPELPVDNVIWFESIEDMAKWKIKREWDTRRVMTPDKILYNLLIDSVANNHQFVVLELGKLHELHAALDAFETEYKIGRFTADTTERVMGLFIADIVGSFDEAMDYFKREIERALMFASDDSSEDISEDISDEFIEDE